MTKQEQKGAGVRRRLRSMIERLEHWVFYRLTRGTKERRLRRFLEVIRPQAGELLLDIGAGGGGFWQATMGTDAGVLRGLRMVALDFRDQAAPDWYRWNVIGDGRELPFRDQAVGIVFSNSVLEHVGRLEQQRAMAREIERVGGRFFIQVPSRWFPLEAHFFIPFLSYLPVRWQVRLTRWCFGYDEEIHLPSRRTVTGLFPRARVETERWLGLPKAYWIYTACG